MRKCVGIKGDDINIRLNYEIIFKDGQDVYYIYYPTHHDEYGKELFDLYYVDLKSQRKAKLQKIMRKVC